jgi:hypothetical protein
MINKIQYEHYIFPITRIMTRVYIYKAMIILHKDLIHLSYYNKQHH